MSEFDWVRARSDCTLDTVFERLAEAVREDLEKHAALNPGLAQCQKFEACGDEKFFVERTRVHRVVFEKTQRCIQIGKWLVDGKHVPLMKLTVRLNDEGHCVLVDKERGELQPWQVRRKALEETFFGAP